MKTYLLYFVLLCTHPCFSQLDSLLQLRYEALLSKDLCGYYSLQSDIEDVYKAERNLDSIEYAATKYDLIPETVEDSFCLRKGLMLHGYMLKKYLGDLTGAVAFYERAHAMLRDKNELDELAWFTENWLANLYAQLNDYDRAIYFSKKVEKALKKSGDLGKLGRLYSNMGDLYKWKESPEEAKAYYESGLVIGEKTKNNNAITGNLMSIASLSLEKDEIDEFLIANQRLAPLIEQVKHEGNDIRRLAEYKLLYAAYLGKIGRTENQIESLTEVVDLYKLRFQGSRVREIAKVYVELVHASLQANQTLQAEIYFRQGLRWILPDLKSGEMPSPENLIAENTIVDLMLAKSELLKRTYSQIRELSYLDSANVVLKLASEANAILQDNLLLAESKYISVALNKEVLSTRMDILYELYSNTSDESCLKEIEDLFLESKVVLLNEKRILQARIKEQDLVFRDSLKYLQRILLDAYALDNGHNEDSLDQVIFRTEGLISSMKGELYAELPKYTLLQSPSLEFFWGTDFVYCMDNFSKNRVCKVGLTDSLQMIVDKLRQSVNTKDFYTTREFSERLGKYLFSSIKEIPKNLVIIPDGALLLIPWDILVYDSKELIHIQEYTIKYSRRIAERSKAISYDDFVAVCPVYKDLKRMATTRKAKGPLKFSKSEVDSISKINFESFYVTEKLDLQLLENSTGDVFHFSGHASGLGEHTCLYGVDASGNPAVIDGRQISNSDIGFDLVVLSACETGVGHYLKGEGVKSLAYDFLYAGASEVVYSLWEVNDKTTAKLMQLFYKNLKETHNPNLSLQEAKRTFISAGTPEEKDPYYWAGFICVSENQLVANNDRSSYFILIGGLILLISSILFYKVYSP